MLLQSLRVIHLPKSPEKSMENALPEAFYELLKGAFYLNSCQRRLWVCTEALLGEEAVPEVDGMEVFEGAEAYRFLLHVTTGLASQIQGETDIFGQFKEAWQRALPQLPQGLRLELSPWIQRLFEDTKEIRSRYLQNLGGVSYGTLVRKMIRDYTGAQGPVLIIGAGQIARAVAPFFDSQEVWLWNRSEKNLLTLQHELIGAGLGEQVRLIQTAEEEADAWRKAAHVVVCIPVDPDQDSRRVALWNEGAAQGFEKGTVIHLGGYRNECGVWASLNGFHSLDNLFELQEAQGKVRSVQISRARRACEERAKLRALGASITIPHGWEDLAAFA